MNFFKTVFLDDDDENQDQPTSSNPPETKTQNQNPGSCPNPDEPNSLSSSSSSSFSFVGLMKSLQVNSEWMETYKRDLSEFGSGLRRESELLKQVVKDLPDLSAVKAQGPLESLGNVLDNVLKSASEVITFKKGDSGERSYVIVNENVKYGRFELQLRRVQGDESTYVEKVEDLERYEEWRKGFDLEGRRGEVEVLMRENGVVRGVHEKVVGGGVVEDEVFWCRYFYRVWKLERDEEVRERLVKRVMRGGGDEEEELSWDVDDEEEGVEEGGNVSVSSQKDEELLRKVGECKGKVEGTSEGKKEPSEPGRISDFSIISTRPSTEVDDIGWDELEDVGSGDKRKVARNGSCPSREELRRRLSVADDEEEDLSWDIEDDDEPLKG